MNCPGLNVPRARAVVQGLRILLIIDSLGRGGAQRQAYLLARGLAMRGYVVRVVALNDDTDARNLEEIASVAELEIIGRVRLAAELGPIALVRRMRAWRPDVILTMLEVSDVLGRTAGRLYGRARVVTSIRSRNLHKPAWWLALDRLTMPWADRVVYNSNALVSMRPTKEGVRPGQVRVIANGVEMKEMVAAPVDRRDLGIPAECPVVLAVGRLGPEKRFDTLLAAMARLPSDLAGTRLLIAGEGPLKETLSEEAAQLGLTGRVHFLGKRGDVPALLALANVFVLSSAFEGMPNVVLEAMAAGCPVIASRIDGVVELFPDLSYGWLVEPGNPGMLASALGEVLADPAESQRRAERARARAAEMFSADRMVERYAALFDELTAGR